VALREYLQLILKHRYMLAAGLVLGLAFGLYTVMTTETTYRGKVSFFVSSQGEGTVSAANVGDQFATRRVNSYLALLETERLREMILEDTGLELSLGELGRRISGSGDLNTVLLTARVDDPNRDQALTIADSLARQFPQLIATVERPLVGEPTVRLDVVSGPSVSQNAVPTRWILATRALLGLVVAGVIACVRELTDNRLQSIDRALGMAKVPLLGLVTFDRGRAQAPLVLDDGLGSVSAEEYRQLRTSLQFVNSDRRAKVMVVTSSVPGEGKSTTAANLAIAIARSGQRVALVDADLRKPVLGKLFGLEQSAGLVDVVRGRAAVDDVLQRWGAFDLSVLTAGGTTSIPSELLGTVATSRLVTDLRARFDTVIIDSPPLVPVTDAAIVSTLADGVVLVVRPSKATKADFQRSLTSLERVHANVLGLVGSMMPDRTNPYLDGYTYGHRVDSTEAHEPELEPLPVKANADGESRQRFLLEDALRSSQETRR
jgi:capsular exopolysaccharide synthesis family protein